MKKLITLRKALIFLCLFIGIGAVGGALAMFIDPQGQYTGMGGMLPDIQKLPFEDIFFQNLIFPGIALFVIIGATNILASVFLIRKHKLSSIFGLICGILLMLWIIIQFVIFQFNALSTIYFILGFVQVNVGIALMQAERNKINK